MFFGSFRVVSVVLVSALLAACGSDTDKPSNSGSGGTGEAGANSSAGKSDTAGSSGTTTKGGSTSNGGAPSGGTSQTSAGMPGEAGSGDGGMSSTGGGDPPPLDGDGISWTWNGKTYTVNKQMHAGFFNSGATVNISGSDTDDSVPPNMFTLHAMPNKTGTFQCSDYVTALDSSFLIVWQTFDKTMNPPNPGFSYAKELPCEFTITRADSGDTVGDVFEGTFKASLRFPGNGVYMAQDRTGIVGTMRWTKQ